MLQGGLACALAMGDAALAWLHLVPALLQACASAQVLDQAVAAMYQVRVWLLDMPRLAGLVCGAAQIILLA